MLFRWGTMIVSPIVLIIPTLWATYKNLHKLPWGLDSIFGCEEDGWNGNGTDPNNNRQYWKPEKWDRHYTDSQGKPLGTQGWWANYERVDWDNLSFLKKWWLSYQWCALRNVCWNLRLTDWFGTSIHYDDIQLKTFEWEKSNIKPVKAEWEYDGKEYFFRRKYFGDWALEYGWEFYPWVFEESFQSYKDLREKGYGGYFGEGNHSKYKDRSIPSLRIRKKK